jgi:hypothetical protein
MDSHDYLKTYATFYVNECDEYDYAKKIDMLNFIHHASESMMIDLFENGEIPSPLILNEGEKIVGAASKAVEFAQRNPGHTAVAAVAAAAVLTAGVMVYRRFIAKAERECKNAADKGACKREYHNKGLQAQLKALSAGKSKCFKGKNPEKCKAKIDVKIAQVKNKIKG